MRGIGHRFVGVVSLYLGLCASALAQTAPSPPLTRPGLVAQAAISAADTAWMMTSTALVLLMTLPGLALFYAGMVRKKNVLNTMASVVAIAALVSLLWFGAGYSLAFTPGSPWLGGWDRMGFAGLDFQLASGKLAVSHVAPHIPESVYALFQLTFAIITAALLVGA
jgi:Amt family ammonium transporter